MATRALNLILLGFSCLILFSTPSYSQKDRLERGQSTVELTSANGVFKLGFYRFNFTDSLTHSYLKLYYADPQNLGIFEIDEGNCLCILNRDNPIVNGTATLRTDHQGSLKIVPDGGADPVVLYAVKTAANTSVVLENSGNLLLQETRPDGSARVLWRTFDHPTNVLLPGMKLGINLKTGQNWSLTSWRSDLSPAKGSFTLGLDPNAKDQLVIWQKGEVYWRSGPWKDRATLFSKDSYYSFGYVSNEDEVYFNISVGKYATRFPMLILDKEGGLLASSEPYRQIAYCKGDASNPGCVERKPPKCKRSESSGKGFMTDGGFKFPESDNMSLVDCKDYCFSTCSCVAYASTNLDHTGCEIWKSPAGFRASKNGRPIYTLGSEGYWIGIIGIIGLGGLIIFVPLVSIILAICLKFQGEGDGVWSQNAILRELGSVVSNFSKNKAKDREGDGNELQLFPFEIVAAATDYFSSRNKLGEGGYGPVYKGKLPDGQEIAIKRLSRSSRQGLVEFMNEAVLIAKLQHTNLVRLLGFCVQGDEKILIYEYMRNKSLDFFIFDPERRSILNWTRRFAIIEGIAQGMLYLHKYSRLRVIHRDLKASNILLDSEMNPKISDFGLARIFGRHESEANTNRVVGTHGYMSPEYAFQGLISIKTDIFSFGVLLLEIISGKKNNSLYHSEHPLNLTGYAWQLWDDGRALEVIEPTLNDDESCPRNEILRCIHVSLLCVQDNAADRPNMLDVISMLSHPSTPIPAPSQPAFFFSAVREEHDISEMDARACSMDQASITVMEAR